VHSERDQQSLVRLPHLDVAAAVHPVAPGDRELASDAWFDRGGLDEPSRQFFSFGDRGPDGFDRRIDRDLVQLRAFLWRTVAHDPLLALFRRCRCLRPRLRRASAAASASLFVMTGCEPMTILNRRLFGDGSSYFDEMRTIVSASSSTNARNAAGE